MRVGVGYSDNPDTAAAGAHAVKEAMARAGRSAPCDLVLLFSTARHDAVLLRQSVVSLVGKNVPVFGGGAVGAISNDHFGYAGDQIILALFWLDGVQCVSMAEEGLNGGEEETGLRLGRRLAQAGVGPESAMLLFYDAVNHTDSGLSLLMATPLMDGLERGLGFLPSLVGAGLQGDYVATPTRQWTGDGTALHSAMALAFSGDIRADTVIMHGCRPATGYYTVTRADRQVVLEIDGEPALDFMDKLLGPAIAVDDYPFFLILGVNKGNKWGEFAERSYVNRLCLGIDKERRGIIMFEPDMVEGTQFQVMYRSLDLDYMPPRIERIFEGLDGRDPVFALYIDCAGRAAGYGGMDIEDALVVQNTVAGRVPLLGIYTGVEIASVEGRPRGLDWTGVFCLFSVPQ